EVAPRGRDHVEGRHRLRKVHAVVEPEAALLRLAPGRVEQEVGGVHLLPAFGAGGRLDLVRAQEPSAHLVSSIRVNAVFISERGRLPGPTSVTRAGIVSRSRIRVSSSPRSPSRSRTPGACSTSTRSGGSTRGPGSGSTTCIAPVVRGWSSAT